MIAYKSTRPDGTDFRTGKVQYAVGVVVEVADPDPPSTGPCGRGLHVSPTTRMTVQYSEYSIRPWRWWEVEVDEAGDIPVRPYLAVSPNVISTIVHLLAVFLTASVFLQQTMAS
jgi:hypothetical protein